MRNRNGRILKDKVDIYLRESLAGLVHRDLGIVDFVKLVYNFEPHLLPETTFKLPDISCMKFCSASNEVASYEHLEKIIQSLQGQLLGSFRTGRLALNFRASSRLSPQGDHANFRPDFFLSTREVNNWVRHYWATGLGYGEVKRSEERKRRTRKIKYELSPIDINILTKVSYSWRSVRKEANCA